MSDEIYQISVSRVGALGKTASLNWLTTVRKKESTRCAKDDATLGARLSYHLAIHNFRDGSPASSSNTKRHG
jgi:hypothetical protein